MCAVLGACDVKLKIKSCPVFPVLFLKNPRAAAAKRTLVELDVFIKAGYIFCEAAVNPVGSAGAGQSLGRSICKAVIAAPLVA
jgi:hypothetical protein